MKKENNHAFIDGQNLYMGTTTGDDHWKIDYRKLRVYLRDKYNVTEAHYFLGYVSEEEQSLYNSLQKAGFIINFKEHSSVMMGEKKGNVDTDIVFSAMRSLLEEDFDKVVLVSGDGDYKKLVDYLIKKHKFKKILFPNKKFASSLYKKLGSEMFDYLENKGIRKKIEYLKKEKGS